MTRTVILAALAITLAIAGAACDSRARASGGGESIKQGRLSKELESCGATAHCADGLRCLEQTCVREQRSNLGDFLAARGAAKLAAGDVDAAVTAYADALATYDTAKLTPPGAPPDVDCAYGLALVHARESKDKAELAARVLHRCLLALPPGGPWRAQALAGLTQLDASGLDPKQLDKPALADLYLTHEPERPATDKLAVAVTADPMPKAKSITDVTNRLASADLRTALVACWEKNYTGAKSKELTARVALKVAYHPSEYDDESGSFSTAVTAPADEASSCVKAAVEPAVMDLKLHEAMDTTLVVTVK